MPDVPTSCQLQQDDMNIATEILACGSPTFFKHLAKFVSTLCVQLDIHSEDCLERQTQCRVLSVGVA